MVQKKGGHPTPGSCDPRHSRRDSRPGADRVPYWVYLRGQLVLLQDEAGRGNAHKVQRHNTHPFNLTQAQVVSTLTEIPSDDSPKTCFLPESIKVKFLSGSSSTDRNCRYSRHQGNSVPADGTATSLDSIDLEGNDRRSGNGEL
jgi:hypothetical protein